METSRSEDSVNSFSFSTSSSNKKRAYRTTNAHFYWVTREAGSFEWFKGVMNEVAEMDKKVTLPLPFSIFLAFAAHFCTLRDGSSFTIDRNRESSSCIII